MVVKKAKQFLIEEVNTREWISIFGVWILLIIIWNYGYPQATPFQDVAVAAILSLLTTAAHEKFSKVK
ncbi:hypothetical protein ACFLQI_01825 [Candidatus Undinarchaeota archaeon]